MALAWGSGAWGDNAWGGGETFPASVTETALLADSTAAGLYIEVSITESLTNGTSWGEGAWGSGSWSGTSGIQDVQTVALTMNVAVDESAAIAEDQSVVANFAGSVTETMAIAEDNAAITSYNVSVADTQTITDDEAAQTSYTESVSDSLGIVEDADGIQLFPPGPKDFDMADTMSNGSQRIDETWTTEGTTKRGNRSEIPLFPPGPKDFGQWERILRDNPHIAPAIESEFHGMVDGFSNRVDRLRACGNAVFPLVAAYAFASLFPVVATNPR